MFITQLIPKRKPKKKKNKPLTNAAIIKCTEILQELKEKGNIWVRLEKLILT